MPRKCPTCEGPLFCECENWTVLTIKGCQACRNRYKEKIDAANTAQQKLSERLAFLKLEDPDSSREIFKGDVVFVLHGCDTIHAHRFVLASKSSVFCRMFDCGMLENKAGVVAIEDASYPVMRAAINYCYTADISFTHEVPPEDVLKVAHKYEMAHLKDVCAEKLCGRINEKNIIEFLRLSKNYEAETLQEALGKYFKKNFDTVFKAVLAMESL